MIFKGLFKKIWGESSEDNKVTSEDIQSLPSVDDATFYKKTKLYLQRFDEYITASEAEVETLSIELDNCLEQEENLEIQLKQLNKPNSWQERHLLLKLDRLQLHCGNLKRRIEIYSQNIRVYLALISQIQDMKAMRMYGGVDETKMETIWLDFKETLEKYKNLLMAESATHDSEKVTIESMETRLSELKKTMFPEVNKPITESKQLKPIEESEQPIKESESSPLAETPRIRPPIENLVRNNPVIRNEEKRMITE